VVRRGITELNIILLVDDEMIKLISIVASIRQERCGSVLRFPKALLAKYGFLSLKQSSVVAYNIKVMGSIPRESKNW